MKIFILLKSRRKELLISVIFLSVLFSLTYTIEHEEQNISPFYIHNAVIESSTIAKLDPLQLIISGKVVDGEKKEIMKGARGIFEETYSEFLSGDYLKFRSERLEYTIEIALPEIENYHQMVAYGISDDLFIELNKSYGPITQLSTVFFTSNASLVPTTANLTDSVFITPSKIIEVSLGQEIDVFPSSNVTDPIMNGGMHDFLIMYIPLQLIIDNFEANYAYKLQYHFTLKETVVLNSNSEIQKQLNLFEEYLAFRLLENGSDLPMIVTVKNSYGIDVDIAFTSLRSLLYNTLVIVQLLTLYSVSLLTTKAHLVNKKIQRIAFQRDGGILSQGGYFILYFGTLLGLVYLISRTASEWLTQFFETNFSTVFVKSEILDSKFNSLFMLYSSFYITISFLNFIETEKSMKLMKLVKGLLGFGYVIFIAYRAMPIISAEFLLFFLVSFSSLVGVGLMVTLVYFGLKQLIKLIAKYTGNSQLIVVTRLTKIWNNRMIFRVLAIFGILILMVSGLYFSLVLDFTITLRNNSLYTSDLIIDYKGENISEFSRFLRNNLDVKSFYTVTSYSMDGTIRLPGIDMILSVNSTQAKNYFSSKRLEQLGINNWIGKLGNGSIAISDDVKEHHELNKQLSFISSNGKLNFTLGSYAEYWFDATKLQYTGILDLKDFQRFTEYFSLSVNYYRINLKTFSGNPEGVIFDLQNAFPGMFDFEGKLSDISFNIISKILSDILPIFITLIIILFSAIILFQTSMDLKSISILQIFAIHQNVNSKGVKAYYFKIYFLTIFSMILGTMLAIIAGLNFLLMLLNLPHNFDIYSELHFKTLILNSVLFSLPLLAQLLYEYMVLSRKDKSLVLRYAE